MKLHQFITLFISLLFFASCDNKEGVIVESYQDFENGTWAYDSVAVFEFDIQDIASQYVVSFNTRNTLEYENYNLYIRFELFDAEGKLLRSNMKEAILMESKTGKPQGTAKSMGTGAANIYTTKTELLSEIKFEKQGKYQLKLSHYMRKDDLEGIMGVGILVVKKQAIK